MDIFLFLLGYKVQFAAACLLALKIYKQKTIYGLSIDTQICFLIANISRCVWTLETRLVETPVAYGELILSTLVSMIIVYFCYRHSQDVSQVVSPPEYLTTKVLIPIAGVAAFFANPGHDWFTFQILVAFTMYAEALAMIPQLVIMRKIYFIEPLTSHYVAGVVISRLIRMIFWGTLFWQGEHFLQLFLADIIHTALSADYLFLWVRKLSDGGKLVVSSPL